MGQTYSYEEDYIPLGFDCIYDAQKYVRNDDTAICKKCQKSFRLFDLTGSCNFYHLSNSNFRSGCTQIIQEYFDYFKWYNSRQHMLRMNLIVRHNLCDSCSNEQYKTFMNFDVVVYSDGKNHFMIDKLEIYETEMIDEIPLLVKIIKHGSKFDYTVMHELKWKFSKKFGKYIPYEIRKCEDCNENFLDLSYPFLYANSYYSEILKYLGNKIPIQNNGFKLQHFCGN